MFLPLPKRQLEQCSEARRLLLHCACIRVGQEPLAPSTLTVPPFHGRTGLWKLVYTTAVDVTPILGLERRFPGPDFLSPRVGDIYQRFSSPADGSVQNIIQLSVPGGPAAGPRLGGVVLVWNKCLPLHDDCFTAKVAGGCRGRICSGT